MRLAIKTRLDKLERGVTGGERGLIAVVKLTLKADGRSDACPRVEGIPAVPYTAAAPEFAIEVVTTSARQRADS